MSKDQDQVLRQSALLCLIGFWLLGVVLLAPHAGYLEGRSFFEVAKASPWQRWGDWAAAWCSVKIILLSVAAFAIAISLGIFLMIMRRIILARLAFLSVIAPGLGLLLGCYYLLKALL